MLPSVDRPARGWFFTGGSPRRLSVADLLSLSLASPVTCPGHRVEILPMCQGCLALRRYFSRKTPTAQGGKLATAANPGNSELVQSRICCRHALSTDSCYNHLSGAASRLRGMNDTLEQRYISRSTIDRLHALHHLRSSRDKQLWPIPCQRK
jgi:hypothetical protein